MLVYHKVLIQFHKKPFFLSFKRFLIILFSSIIECKGKKNHCWWVISSFCGFLWKTPEQEADNNSAVLLTSWSCACALSKLAFVWSVIEYICEHIYRKLGLFQTHEPVTWHFGLATSTLIISPYIRQTWKSKKTLPLQS